MSIHVAYIQSGPPLCTIGGKIGMHNTKIFVRASRAPLPLSIIHVGPPPHQNPASAPGLIARLVSTTVIISLAIVFAQFFSLRDSRHACMRNVTITCSTTSSLLLLPIRVLPLVKTNFELCLYISARACMIPFFFSIQE